MKSVIEGQTATRSGAGPSDAALVVAARAGEMWAKETLFRRHARLVNGLAFRLLGQRDEVEDHVQEAFCAAFRALDTMERPQAFASFLCSITVRTVYRTLKRRKLLTRLGFRHALPIDDADLVSKAAPADVVAELKAILGSFKELSAVEQIVLSLRHIEGYTLDEIATLSGISIGTVKRKLARAERVLKERFAGGGS
jgi:RNA polymerase sigma-70 factor (ECF subfamily)